MPSALRWAGLTILCVLPVTAVLAAQSKAVGGALPNDLHGFRAGNHTEGRAEYCSN